MADANVNEAAQVSDCEHNSASSDGDLMELKVEFGLILAVYAAMIMAPWLGILALWIALVR